MNSHLSQIPVTTVTFARTIEEETDLPIGEHECPDCGVTLAGAAFVDLLIECRKRVLHEVGLMGFTVVRVVDTQPWGESTEPSDAGANGRKVDFWDGAYRVEQVRVCLEIVGDVAKELAEVADRAGITGGYLLGNQVQVRCEAPVDLGLVALGLDRYGLKDSCRAA
jgi:hypothetical protein